MIYYLVKQKYSNTLGRYLESWGLPVSKNFKLLYWETVFENPPCEDGVYIFSDLERLSFRQLEQAATLWTALKESKQKVQLLNHPTRVLRRYELLRTLFERGINDFNIYRLSEVRSPRFFPVFIRLENSHGDKSYPLLKNETEFNKALEQFAHYYRCREDSIVVEFSDTKSADGLFRKYAAFNIGGNIFARHLFFNRDWVVKSPGIIDETLAQEEMTYVSTNPHKELLREIFDIARIDYGRIDYGFKNGKLIVWEINTNPALVSFLADGGREREEVNRYFSRNYNQTVSKLDTSNNRPLWDRLWKKL